MPYYGGESKPYKWCTFLVTIAVLVGGVLLIGLSLMVDSGNKYSTVQVFRQHDSVYFQSFQSHCGPELYTGDPSKLTIQQRCLELEDRVYNWSATYKPAQPPPRMNVRNFYWKLLPDGTQDFASFNDVYEHISYGPEKPYTWLTPIGNRLSHFILSLTNVEKNGAYLIASLGNLTELAFCFRDNSSKRWCGSIAYPSAAQPVPDISSAPKPPS